MIKKVTKFLLITQMIIIKLPFLYNLSRRQNENFINYIWKVYTEYDSFLSWESEVFKYINAEVL